MSEVLHLYPDRFLGQTGEIRSVARRLFTEVESLPIISPHGHTEPRWFADNKVFDNPTDLLIVPDHYIFRMLYSQGVSLESLRIPIAGNESKVGPLEAWGIFADYYYLFQGTPTRIWLDYVFYEVFGIRDVLSAKTAQQYYEKISHQLKMDALRPRAILDRFNIEFLATTDGALDSLQSHENIARAGFGHRVVPTFRPDSVIDPDCPGFFDNVGRLSEITGEEATTWNGYLSALKNRREFFKSHGATATDHGHPSAHTSDLSNIECQKLFAKCLRGDADAQEKEYFRGQMLTEMAAMSLDDGLVMQLHVGVSRNHNKQLFNRFGQDKGADIPIPMEFVEGLKPLLQRFGNESSLSVILFTLDESTYSRELAPLAGHYPCLRLGPAWWFHDSPEGMMRYRQQVSETAGFYNTVGFNDDTRALFSIPARHDLARRIDCQFLAGWVVQRRLSEDQALLLAKDLAYRLPKDAYKVEQ